MKQIHAVGFDMDYTLAQYKKSFDLLPYEGAKEKLVNLFHYPTEVLSLIFDEANDRETGTVPYTLFRIFFTDFSLVIAFLGVQGSLSCRRGCILDTARGNLLKLDQHYYPTVVEHGFRRLSTIEKHRIYRESYQEAERFKSSPEFFNLDTPFSLVDAFLYTQLVDMKDRYEREEGIGKSLLSI
jgi:hypothetical protein